MTIGRRPGGSRRSANGGPDDFSDTMAFSAADARFFGLLQDLVSSVRRHVLTLPLAVFDLGLLPEQRAWLDAGGIRLLTPRIHFNLPPEFSRPLPLSLLVRPFLPEYVPGRELYLWLDADAWVQDGDAIERLRAGARAAGMAVVHEAEPAYRFQMWLEAWTWKHAVLGFGLASAIRQRLNRQTNAGVFCVRRDAPHWRLWRIRFEQAIGRTGRVAPYDQFALNEMIYRDRPAVAILEPGDNWICDRALPAWDNEEKNFVKPYLPHGRIGILHLAGPAKNGSRAVRVVQGGLLERWLTYSGTSSMPEVSRETSLYSTQGAGH
jgi:hypothetical protein